jgi:DNA-binding response OmpR family regulator
VDTSVAPPVVLVVDDEMIIADTLAMILAKKGCAALVAYDAESALEIADLIPPDLLLTDVVMPGENGVELAMKVLSLAPDCRILLLSGQAATSDLLAQSGLADDKFVLMGKPVPPRELLDQVWRLGVTPPEMPA